MTLPIYCSITYSPSWYTANAIDTFNWNHDEKSGIFYYGARNSIYFMKVNEITDETKLISDNASRNIFYDAKLLFYIKAHHDFIVGVYTLKNEVMLGYKDEKKIAKLVSCGRDKMVRVWSFDESDGCCCLKEFNISNTKLTTNVTCISVCESNIVVCGFEKGFLLTWSYVTDEWKTFTTENEDIITITCSATKLAIGHKRGLVSVFSIGRYDTLTKLTRFRAHQSDTCNISWNPFPETVNTWGDLATSGKDSRVSLWRIDTNVNLSSIKLPSFGRKFVYDGKSINKDSGSSWSSLCWSDIDNGTLLASTAFGNIGIWKSPTATELKCFPHNTQMKIHNKTVFGISEWRNYRGLIVSHSLDRTINIARVTESGTTEGCVYSISGLGGSVMSLSGIGHTNQLAIGCGDNNIRLWKYDSVQRRTYDINNIWNGINGKVMCVCWHPYREGLLAFGTEDGQVGFINIARDKKIATSSQMHHKGKVFVVTWGLDLQKSTNAEHDGTAEDNLIVYSVGNYALFGHDFRRENYFDATNFVSNSTTGISDFCVHSSLRYAAVGYSNGMVNLFALEPVVLICVINSHSKGINCLRWSLLGNGDKLAIGSNERFLTITDLSTVFREFVRRPEGEWTVLEVIETAATFKGHGDRITCVDWSPFDEDKLVSGSYDYTVFVWSVAANGPVASFTGHQGKVLCCHWSPRDPDLIYTGGDDCNIFLWRLSEQSLHSKLNKRRQAHDVPGIGTGGFKLVAGENSQTKINYDENDSLNLTEEPLKVKEVKNAIDAVEEEVLLDTKASSKKTFVKKRSSLFPTTLFGVHHSLEDYQEAMIKFINNDDGYLDCFAMFSSRAMILAAIDKELDHHSKEGNYDNYFIILIWTGRIGKVIRECVSRNYSPDWLMALIFNFTSKSVPEDLIQTMIGNIITERKDPLLAATCLLATYQSTRAIDLLVSHNCLREALILAKLRLSPDHPLIQTELMLQLQANYYRNGSYELAAMCSLVLGNYRGFVDTMHRRNSLQTSWTVIKVMITVRQDDIAQQCVANFVNTVMLQVTDFDNSIDSKQWLGYVRNESCLAAYSLLLDVHTSVWINKVNLAGLVSAVREACVHCDRDKLLELQSHIRARLNTKQTGQVKSQILVHVTYQLFVILVSGLYDVGDESIMLDSLKEELKYLKVISGDECVLEQLMADITDKEDLVIHRLQEDLTKLEI